MQKKYRLAKDKRRSAKGTRTDGSGYVVIKIFIADKGHVPRTGNMIKTIRLEKAKVSTVHKQILELFDAD